MASTIQILRRLLRTDSPAAQASSFDPLEAAAQFLAFTPIRQKVEQQTRREATGLAREAFLTLQRQAAARQLDAGMANLVQQIMPDAPPVEPGLLEAAIKANANSDTGFMRSTIRVDWNPDRRMYEVRSPGCDYMRAQNWGYPPHLGGHYFVEKGAADVGVPLDMVTIPEDFNA